MAQQVMLRWSLVLVAGDDVTTVLGIIWTGRPKLNVLIDEIRTNDKEQQFAFT